MRGTKEQKGITLIALIITIIILLILAGISISALTNQGLFSQAENAKKTTENAQIKEEETLVDYETTIGEYVEGTREQITVDKAEYEQLKTDVASLKQQITNSNIKMTSLKKLCSANMKAANNRSAGTYKSSQSIFVKNNTEIMDNYLEYIDGVGWKFKKSGWYYIQTYARAEYVSGKSYGSMNTFLRINGNDFKLNHSEYVPSVYYTAEDEPNVTLWFNENDILDYSYTITSVANYSGAQIDIYALFE